MSDPVRDSGMEAFPQAVEAPRRKSVLPLVWLVPIVAIVAGGWLAVKAVLDKGPTVTISFRSAEGLEAGKTKIKFKDVDIGLVKEIALAKDHSRVIVTAELNRSAQDFLVEDTRFWVVRPTIRGGVVSGLGTLLSGAYIGVDIGKSETERWQFEGLEVPPVLTSGLPGREFVLKANDIASIGYGTPVYFRRVEVGEVTAYELDRDGRGVSVRIFVHAPYDRFVTAETRFWQASGIDVALDATGVQVRTESLVALLSGGIAFGTPPDAAAAEPAPPQSAFSLFPRRVEAFKRPDTRIETYILVFKESVRGLSVGAPLDFRGIAIGEVSDIGIDFDMNRMEINMVVEVRMFPDRLAARVRKGVEDAVPARAASEDEWRRRLQALVDSGLRAQLRTGNLLTGQLYVALDFFPKAPKMKLDFERRPTQLPTIPGGLQELQESLGSIAKKLDAIPYDRIAADLRQSLQTLDTTLKSVDALVQRLDRDVTPEVKATLEEARRTFANAERTLAADAPLQTELRDALREVSRTAKSVRILVDYLERHPEALLKGKPEGTP